MKKDHKHFLIGVHSRGEKMFPASYSGSSFWGPHGATILAVPTNPTNSDVSTADTLLIMSALARRDADLPIIKTLSTQLASGCATLEQVLQSIWYWVHDSVEFEQHEDTIPRVLGVDGIDKQLLISPGTLLSLPHPKGDCAVFATLTASLLSALGLQSLYKVIAADSQEPDRWSHVYVFTPFKGSYYSMDTSHGKYPGWEYRNRIREMTWAV